MVDAAANFTRNLLSYSPGIHDVVAAADEAPTNSTLNAYAAAVSISGMTPASYTAATPYLRRAVSSAETPDDAALAAAMQAWQRGDLTKAIGLLRQRIEQRPDELASLKLCQLLHLDLGDFSGMVETIQAVLPHHADNHFVLGQLAFALDEAGRGEEAGRFARLALAGAEQSGADDPWSVHAYMHALHRRGSLQQSIDLVVRCKSMWVGCGTFMQLHAWWHAAIALLDLGRHGAAIAVYDAYLASADAACVQSLVARVSLLARMELLEVDVGGRWQPLKEALHERAGDGINGFLDVHYVYGLALSGAPDAARKASARLSGLSKLAAEALLDHAAGRYDQAAYSLAALGPGLQRLGGSHEQRQLYGLVQRDAARRAARVKRASDRPGMFA